MSRRSAAVVRTWGPMDYVWSSKGADLFANQLQQLPAQRVAGLGALHQRDVRVHALALDVVRYTASGTAHAARQQRPGQQRVGSGTTTYYANAT